MPTPTAPTGPVVFVRGGGSAPSSASETLYKRRFHEAEARRDADAADRAVAATQQRVDVPEEIGGGKMLLPGPEHQKRGLTTGGVMYSHSLTDHPDVAKGEIVLDVLDRHGNPVEYAGVKVQCLADLMVGAGQTETELTLIIVCPRCAQRGVKSLGDCQLRIHQSNRYFEFVPADKQEIVTFNPGGGAPKSVHISAGTIRESEPFKCGDCNWRARITNNCLRPD